MRPLRPWSGRHAVGMAPHPPTVHTRIPTPPTTAAPGLDALAVEVAAALPSLDDGQRRVGLAVYRLLAAGRPATAPAVAASLGEDVATVAQVLADLPTATVSDGATVAFLGLQREPGRHTFRVGGTALATWCAWDALFLPALVGRAAEARSRCPVSGDEVAVEIDPVTGVTSATPAGAVVSFLAHPAPFDGDVVAGFCRWIHFLADRVAAEEWCAGTGEAEGGAQRPKLIVLSLADGVALGRRTNSLVFGQPG